MHTHQLLSRVPTSSILLILLTVLVGGCNLPFISASTTTTASATACPSPIPFQAARGTIQNINGTTLLITDTTGNTVKATYTSTTRFTREAKVTMAALKEGALVFVAVTQNANNTYTATRISLSNAGNQGSRPRGAFGGSGRRGGRGCNREGLRGSNADPSLAGGNGNTRGVTGTVSQLNGNTLTVTDSNQADYTIALNSTTQIIQTSQVSATSLQVGLQVNLVGLRNAQGVITARSVTILLPGSGK